MTPQSNQPSPSDDSALIQGKLLRDLGFLEIFRLKEFNKETPAVVRLFHKANSPQFKSRIWKALNVNVSRQQGAISLLRHLLKPIRLKTQETRQNSKGTRFYTIIPKSDDDFLVSQSMLDLKYEDKLIEICQDLFNKCNLITQSESLKKSGVYKITCLPTGDFYIGSCKNFGVRFYQHKFELKRLKPHYNLKLQKLWNRYGEGSFKFEILEVTENYKEREEYLIKKLKPSLNSKYPGLIRVSSEIDERLRVVSKRLGKDRAELANEFLDKGLRELGS